MRRFRDLLKDESGIAVEYMLIIAVVVAGIIAATAVFWPKFQEGVDTLGGNVQKKLGDGMK